MEMNEEFYDATVETILVPVRVAYHAGSNVLYTYELPTRETIKDAMKATHGLNLTNARQGVSEASRLLRTLMGKDRRMEVVIDYIEAAARALGLRMSTFPEEAPVSGTRNTSVETVRSATAA